MMQPFTIVKYIPATVNDCKIRTHRKRQPTSTAIVKRTYRKSKYSTATLNDATFHYCKITLGSCLFYPTEMTVRIELTPVNRSLRL